jgi:hypothetical protein
MKQKDVALIIAIGFVSAVFALLLSNFLISSPKNRQQKAEVVEAITDEFQQPDERYFNDLSVNPTKQIRIGDAQNPLPFNQ